MNWLPALDPKLPKYRALYQAIVSAVEAGDLRVGARLPTHRAMADELGITVGVVTKAYALAMREGFLQSRVGSGTFVALRGQGFTPFPQQGRAPQNLLDLSISIAPPNPRRADILGRSLQQMTDQTDVLHDAVQYHHANGEWRARQAMAGLMDLCGITVSSDELLLTMGGQHGLTLACDVLLRDQGHLATAEIGYLGIVGLARMRSLKLVAIPLKNGALDVDAIEGRAKQQRIDAVYVTPDFHNPTGVSLDSMARQRLALLAEAYDFWIIEDSVHTVIGRDKPPAMFELAPDRTITVFSTAKLLAGGIRLGAIRVPASHRDQFATAIKLHAWMVPPLLCHLVGQWMESGEAGALLEWQRSEMQARQELAIRYLAPWLAHRPEPGCFYLWLQMERPGQGQVLGLRLLEQGIKVGQGAPFWIGAGPAPDCIRLCLSPAYNRDTLENALRLMAKELRAQHDEFVTV